MDVWIVVPYGYEQFTAVYTKERRAIANQHAWQRQLVEADVFAKKLNEEPEVEENEPQDES